MSLEKQIELTRTAREKLDRAKALHRLGEISYDQLAEAAMEFCAAFDVYHQLKFGKPKRLDYRAIIR